MGAKCSSEERDIGTEKAPAGQQGERAFCPACLDLRYDLFHLPNIEPLLYRGQGLRYHISSFWELEEAAKNGCRCCSIIREALHRVWKVSPDTFTETLSKLALREWEQWASNTALDSSNYHEDDDEHRFYRPCIEIRHQRSLIVSCVSTRRVRPVASHLEIIPGSKELLQFLQRAPLEFFTENGDEGPSVAFGKARLMPELLEESYCKLLLSEWLRQCVSSHAECEESGNNTPPKRLLDVSGQSIRLVHTPSHFQEQYTTLSHCWGSEEDSPVPKTTSINLSQRLEHVEEQELPSVFQDAVLVTRMVGQKFLWIDSLCIIQDDDKDWKEQSYLMAQIYSQSFLNIAATASRDSSRSIFFKRYHACEPDHRSHSMQAHKLSDGVYVRPFPQIIHGNFMLRRPEDDNSPLLKRGWVFQERLLSRRTIHFASSELVWECRRHTHCECGDLDSADPAREIRTSKSQFEFCLKPETTQQSTLDTWLSIVTRYNNLRFSKTRDWPFAFAGIADKIWTRVRSRYLAGLWEIDLARGLLWIGLKARRSDLAARNNCEDVRNCGSRGPPSWSWLAFANWSGSAGIQYHDYLLNFDRNIHLQFDLEHTYCTTEDQNQFGPVIEGSLRVRGIVAQGTMYTGSQCEPPLGFSPSHITEDAYIRFEKFGGLVGFPFHCDFYLPVDGFNDTLERDAFCLLIGNETKPSTFNVECRDFSLILAPVDGSANSYRRIGIAKWPKSSNAFEGENERIINIL